MLTRLSAMLPINTRGMWVGTFHGLCNRLLRAHYRDAGLPQTFQILDSADQLVGDQAAAEGQRHRRREVSAARGAVLHQQRQGRGPARRRDVEVNDDFNRRLVELYAEYDAQCQREGVVDFAELLLRCYELLARNETAARALPAALPPHPGRRVPGHQQAAVHAGSSCCRARSNAMFAVGDDDQSIYASAAPTSATWPSSSAIPRAEPDPARAELPLARPHPRRGQRADRATTHAASARICGPSRHGEPVRVYEAQSDGDEAAVARRRDQGTDRRRHARAEIARAVPLQRAVARARAALFSAGDPVPGLRRPAVLRARRRSSTRSPTCG